MNDLSNCYVRHSLRKMLTQGGRGEHQNIVGNTDPLFSITMSSWMHLTHWFYERINYFWNGCHSQDQINIDNICMILIFPHEG